MKEKKIIDSLASKIDKDGNHLFTKKDGTKYCKKNLYCGGSGKHNYTSNRKLEKKYDLSNHKYIETKYKGQYVFISCSKLILIHALKIFIYYMIV